MDKGKEGKKIGKVRPGQDRKVTEVRKITECRAVGGQVQAGGEGEILGTRGRTGPKLGEWTGEGTSKFYAGVLQRGLVQKTTWWLLGIEREVRHYRSAHANSLTGKATPLPGIGR